MKGLSIGVGNLAGGVKIGVIESGFFAGLSE